ncbi:hypothetical protein ColTof3_08479 [Colletotrichum tofieldiae]|nr:hypothetical protein ColTof3_08479 [Colletotrichum tofieldiae]
MFAASPGIDWLIAERQLQGWSQLLCAGKRLKPHVQLDYVESAPAGRPAGRGAIAISLAERGTRIDAGQAATGGLDAWRRVYQPMRCPGVTGLDGYHEGQRGDLGHRGRGHAADHQRGYSEIIDGQFRRALDALTWIGEALRAPVGTRSLCLRATDAYI